MCPPLVKHLTTVSASGVEQIEFETDFQPNLSGLLLLAQPYGRYRCFRTVLKLPVSVVVPRQA